MKKLTLNQIVSAVNRAYNILHVRQQYDGSFVEAIGECHKAKTSLASIHGNISATKSALTAINNMLADEYIKLDKAQTEKEINEIVSDIRWYSIDRAKCKQSLKFYRDTERSIMINCHAAYKQLLKHYQDAIDVIAMQEAEAKKAEEAKKAAEEASLKADLYTLSREEAVELLAHITKALTSNKDEQQFYLDMSHYKK